jgi:hypothetical protein
MESFNSIFPRFNKENIAFSMDKFTGQSKYPINLWNEADSRGRNFYLKSLGRPRWPDAPGSLPIEQRGQNRSF